MKQSFAGFALVWLMLPAAAWPRQTTAAEPAQNQAANEIAPLAAARKLFMHGNYAEAGEAFAKLAEGQPATAMGVARCQRAAGKDAKARETLDAAAKRFPKSAAVLVEAAQSSLDVGDYPRAQRETTAALAIDGHSLPARWLSAELHRLAGRMKEANAGYLWLVDEYNRRDDITDPEALRAVGLAAAQHARWNQLSDEFQMLIAEVYPQALKLDADYWPARYESGMLLAEKYNQRGATREFKAALAINPNAAEVHAALAALSLQNFDLAEAKASLDRALEINPRLLTAQQTLADLHLSNFEVAEAVKVLEHARRLNAVDEATLGRLAAAYAAQDGLPANLETAALDTLKGSRLGKLIDLANEHNPYAGEFHAALAEAFDRLRKYPAAVRFYREAVQRMPESIAARDELGMVQMRLGQEAEAAKTLRDAFARDPFHVRVSNTLKVLDVLAGYATIETEHFIVRFDRGQDELLGRRATRFLEDQVYPLITKQLGYAPREKSLFEIFNRSGNTDGHGWFSARMTGVPNIGTVGACAGRMVALTSPASMQQKFNWARVLQHEFVHVVNLQQTNFNIPHWYTEGLAVSLEGYPPPASWNDLLGQRLTADKLFHLDTINLAFVRPKSPADWQLAYCQSWLYVRYMLDRFGADANQKMLQAYAENLDTPAAVKRCFNIELTDFEHGYREFLDRYLAGLPRAKAPAAKVKLADLKKQVAAVAKDGAPRNASLLAQLALAELDAQDFVAAREAADGALAVQPKQALAAYVRARLLLRGGDAPEALKTLEDSLDRAAPEPKHLALLAGMKVKAEEFTAATELYELGAKTEPANLQWTQSLAKLYLRRGDDARLSAALTTLAAADPDDALLRKKLAELAIVAKDFDAAWKWTEQLLQIDATDVDAYRLQGEAAAGRHDTTAALAAYETAISLLPDKPAARLALAKLYLEKNQTDKARMQLHRALKLDPTNDEVKKLIDELK